MKVRHLPIIFLGIAFLVLLSFYSTEEIVYSPNQLAAPQSRLAISNTVVTKTPQGAAPDLPPITTISLDGTQGLNNYWISDVEVNLTAVDEIWGVNKTYYSFDNLNWFIYSDPFMVTSDGTTTIWYYSTNLGGLIEETKSESINIDRTHPETTVTLTGTQDNDNWWISEVKVTISSVDDYSSVGEITWSIDGINWNNYEEPFNITTEGTTTLQFNATDLAGNVEPTNSLTFKIDTSPPVSNIQLGGTLQNGWYVSNVDVSIGAKDSGSGVARITYSFDGTTWLDFTGGLQITEDGIHTIYYNASDAAGNSESPQSCVIQIDQTAPETTASLSGTLGLNDWYISNVTIELTAIDDASGVDYIVYWLEGGSVTTYEKPFNISDEGPKTIYFKAFDLAGNVEITNSVPLKIDKTPPVSSIQLGGTIQKGWYVTDVAITLGAEDSGSEVARITYSFDGTTWLDYPGWVDIIEDGTYTFYYNASDAAGNSESPQSRVIQIDQTAPETTASLSGTLGLNDWYISDVTVEIITLDPASGVDYIVYWVEGGSVTTYETPFTISDEGSTTIYFKAFDLAGNAEITNSVPLKIDKTPPVSSIQLGGTIQKGWYVTDVAITLDADDSGSGVARITYSFDTITWITYSDGLEITEDGTYTFYYNASDAAGNSEGIEKPIIIKIDKTAPDTTASITGTLGANNWYISNVTIELIATDAGSGVDYIAYWIDDGSETTYKKPFNISDEGTATVFFKAVDVAGNVEIEDSVIIAIDKTPPSLIVHFITKDSSSWFSSDAIVGISAYDDTSGVDVIQYNFNGEWLDYISPITISAEGITELTGRAIDVAGNVATDSLEIKIDKTPPVTTATLTGTLGLNGWYTSDVTIELSATDDLSGVHYTEYRIGKGLTLPYGTPFTISSEGSTTIYFRTYDIAGNGEVTNSITIRIDKTPPEITADTDGIEGNDGWYLSDVIVNFTAVDETSGVDYIQHFDDGQWLTYSEPITITTEGTMTLLYRSFDKAGNIASGSVYLKIDKTPPISSVSLVGTEGLEGWFASNVEVLPGANDVHSGVARITYSLDGTTWIDFLTILDITEEGTHTLYYNASDVAGNSEPPNLIIIEIDKTPPSTMMSIEGIEGSNEWFISAVNISFSSIDEHSGIGHIYYRMNGEAWNEYNTDFVTLGNEGQYSIEYYCIDVAGNEEDSKTDLVKIDLVPPETTLLIKGTKGLEGWFVSSVGLSLSSIDTQSGVSKIYYSPNGLYWVEYKGKAIISYKIDGNYTFYYYAIDEAGNIEETKSKNILIDTQPPETSIILIGDLSSEGFYTSNVEVTLIANDVHSGVASTKYSLDEVTWNDYSEPFIIEDEGNTTIWFYSSDIAGNTEDMKDVNVEIHKAVPKTWLNIDVYYEENEIVYVTSTSKFTLFTEIEVTKTFYRINGVDWIEYIDPFNLTGPDGVYVIDYFSTSLSGINETVQTANVTLTSIHVQSFLTSLPSPPFKIRSVDSLELIFIKRWNKDYKLLRTKPCNIWFNIWLDNWWPIDGDDVNITPYIPSDFEMDLLIVWIKLRCHCRFPIYLFWNGTGRCPIIIDLDWIAPLEVKFDGEMVKVSNLPAGGEVYITIRTRFALKGLAVSSLEEFIFESYVYSVTVEGSGGNPSEPGEGLLGVYSSCAELTRQKHDSKGHNAFCKCFKTFGHKSKQCKFKFRR